MAAYVDLLAKVDAFAARVTARHGDDLRCAPGCDDCCRVALSVTPVEAEALAAHLATLDEPTRARLTVRAAAAGPARCVALEDDGRCAVYPARPLVCRTHGLPIRLRAARRLPIVTACDKNFTRHGPAAADADCVLDQETLSTLLAAVNGAAGHARDERIALAAVVLGRE